MTTLGMPAAFPAVHAVEAAARPREEALGVDTHKDVHVAAVVDHLGRLLSSGEFPATAAGYRHLLHWARPCGTVLRAGVECTGSYGAGLARYLATRQIPVVEVNQPDRSTRRRRGKTDTADAEATARMSASAVRSGTRNRPGWRRRRSGAGGSNGAARSHGSSGTRSARTRDTLPTKIVEHKTRD